VAQKKKAVWITGASSGIGKALSIEFAKNGLLVLGTARRSDLLQEIKNELDSQADNLEPYQLDISNPKSIQEFYKNISSTYEIDCLINNAGTTSFKNALDNSIEEIQNIINANLLGSIYSIKTILPEMIERKSGTIINILSVVTQKVFTASSIYSAAKSGLLAYSKVLREELRDKNIRIINISPGATATPIWPSGILNKDSERMINPQSIAQLVFNLYSEKSNLVTEEVVIRPITGDL
jgi:NADP-dependent 3-hydroxy acid dehydrogenase YdfG